MYLNLNDLARVKPISIMILDDLTPLYKCRRRKTSPGDVCADWRLFGNHAGCHALNVFSLSSLDADAVHRQWFALMNLSR